MLQAFVRALGYNDVTAYLTMMAPRLVEMRRVLKPTGSIYLHCDPTASHYLKALMDSVFGVLNFRNEIVWRRTGAHGKAKRFAPVHDTILFYTKSDSYTWTFQSRPYMKQHVQEYFVKDEKGWRTNYYGNVLTGSGLRKGESGKPWRGFDPSAKGRHWAIPRKLLEEIDEDLDGLSQHEKLDRLLEQGFIKITPGQAWPMYQHYITPENGQALPDIWVYQPYTEGTVFGTDKGIDSDVRWLSPQDQERLGYQTQKPEGLIDRIVQASSNPGDVVLDPFCGCGTAVVAAHRLGRKWAGIDITYLAVDLMKNRLLTTFPGDFPDGIHVDGEPADEAAALALAEQDKFQFQFWAVAKLGGTSRGGQDRKGADRGIDGVLTFLEIEPANPSATSDFKRVIISVKGGQTGPAHVRELRGTMEREQVAIGVLVTVRPPTGEMEREAAEAGLYTSAWDGSTFPKIQIITAREVVHGKRIDMPSRRGDSVTVPTLEGRPRYRKAPRSKRGEQRRLAV
jgi:site-specific DNA-methyltransferase (adenine-specific)